MLATERHDDLGSLRPVVWVTTQERICKQRCIGLERTDSPHEGQEKQRYLQEQSMRQVRVYDELSEGKKEK